ncbi:hypothetical protein POSPLADRAFT_1133052, partial [Postia placenta MAD-698-R-SB12]
HWRMQLNNWLQNRYRSTDLLTWNTSPSGQRHNAVWTAVAYINGVEYGRGTGPSQGAAKEVAAQKALDALT